MEYFKRETQVLSDKEVEIVYFQMNAENSFTGENMRALGTILKEIKENPNKRGVIFASENEKFFCNGLDASNLLATPKEKLVEEVSGIVDLFAETIQFDKPLIAEVSGYAMGGGAVITVACDFRYMLDGKPRIAFTEVLVGLPLPASFIDRIKMCVLPKYWNEVCLTGANYKAKEAMEIGLINDIAPSKEELRKLTLKKMDQLVKIPMQAYRLTKNTLNAPILNRLEEYKKETIQSFAQPGVIDNLLEAMTALKEKRRPKFD